MHRYFNNLFQYEWELFKSPAGANQWRPKNGGGANTVPDPATGQKTRHPSMLTTDLALRFDPAYEKISRRFHENPEEFRVAFDRAWYKLNHRDLGPPARFLGPLVPKEVFIWQDPVPAADGPLVGAAEIAELKKQVMGLGLTVQQLVYTAWSSASTFRGSDKRGGANGARIRLEPQAKWAVNDPEQLAKVLATLEVFRTKHNASGGKTISMADLIVLAGCAAVEEAAKAGGHNIVVPFAPGRGDATQDMTDAPSFAPLEPTVDGFRNYLTGKPSLGAEFLLVDKANLLTLTAPEMTALVGGLRVIGVTYKGTPTGVLTDRVGVLSNDFFVNLLDMEYTWKPIAGDSNAFEAVDSKGAKKWMGSRADLVFGSNSELRALAEVYACNDGAEKLAKQFVAAWDKVMNLDRFDLHE
jgi:catalase-peroxidase